MHYGVLLYNAKEDKMCIIAHNIVSEKEAEQFCQELRRHKLPSFTFKHKSKHRKEEAEKCLSCWREISTMIDKKK